MYTTTEAMTAAIHADMNAYIEQYLAEHPSDWDCCGFAYIGIEFGRKVKIRKQLQDAGIVSQDKYERWGKSHYALESSYMNQFKNVGHQSLTLKEERCDIVVKHLKKLVGMEGIKITVVSWMD